MEGVHVECVAHIFVYRVSLVMFGTIISFFQGRWENQRIQRFGLDPALHQPALGAGASVAGVLLPQ